jgi:hypothetical protein
MSTEQNTETVEQNTENVVGRKSSRSFKVKLEQTGPQYGRYNGDSPYQAANKALSEIIRNKVKNNEAVDEDITFFLVESTKGSSKKVHQYVGKRIKLDEPVKYTVNGSDGEQQIVKEYKNILRKVKKSELVQVDEEQEQVEDV